MSEVLALAERILDDARGSELVEVFVSRGVDTEVRVYQGEIEQLARASGDGVGLRVLTDGPGGARVGTAWVGSLDPVAVAEALGDARDNARFATEDEFVAFARPDGVPAAALELVDDGVASTPLEEKIEFALELERRVRAADPRVRQVEAADYSDYVSEAAIVSSTGVSAVYARSGAFISVEAIANDGDDDQTGWGLSAGRAPGDLDVAKASRDAVERATRMLGAVKPASMNCAVVFDPRTAATLLSVVGSALSGEAVVRGRSFFAERVGDLVASSLFTLIDDPTDARHFAASAYDGEGLACRRNVLIDAGVLQGFVYDTVSARRAGTSSTGSAVRGGIAGSPSAGCRALQLLPGAHTPEELFGLVGDGVYVTSVVGVHSGVNPISGDFSVGVTGLRIRDGRLGEPLREITVASTLQRMLLDVVAVGNDVEWLPGSAAGQSVAVAGIAVSGS